MTFAEMAQALDDMSKKMKQNQNGEVHFKVSANATGHTRQIAGTQAKEMRNGHHRECVDGAKASGYDEVRDFHRRMAEVYKEAAKLDGMPVLQETKMTAEGQAVSQPASQPDGQAQAQPQAQPAPSAGSAIGSALAGRFGLGRKKQDASNQSAPASAPGSLLEMTTEMSNFSSAAVDRASRCRPDSSRKRAIRGACGSRRLLLFLQDLQTRRQRE